MTRPRNAPPPWRAGLLIVTLAALLSTTAGACSREPRTVEIVVPPGTAERLAHGESVTVMPSRLELKVGDTLRIRNDDLVGQAVGPYFVKAGQLFEARYGAPGHYTGMCLLSAGQGYEIVVTQ